MKVSLFTHYNFSDDKLNLNLYHYVNLQEFIKQVIDLKEINSLVINKKTELYKHVLTINNKFHLVLSSTSEVKGARNIIIKMIEEIKQ